MDEMTFKVWILDAICRFLGRAARYLGYKLKGPTFIVGTGRCGTSLLVDILKTHGDLSAFPGEANELWHPKLEPFESAEINIPPIEINPQHYSEVSVANWPQNHKQVVRDIFTGFQILTGPSKGFFGKSAMISFMIPTILEIFPDAKFIHIYRFGPSVVESYVKKNYGKYSRFKCSEQDYRNYCARYWSACILEIQECKERLSLEINNQFIEFSYEELCSNPNETLMSIGRFLGLDPSRFSFDLSRISSQNYKALHFEKTPGNSELFDILAEVMQLKGYLNA